MRQITNHRKLKNSWFGRNWYVVQGGSGYGTKYFYGDMWNVISVCVSDNRILPGYTIFGPFRRKTSMNLCKEENRRHYNSMFSGS